MIKAPRQAKVTEGFRDIPGTTPLLGREHSEKLKKGVNTDGDPSTS